MKSSRGGHRASTHSLAQMFVIAFIAIGFIGSAVVPAVLQERADISHTIEITVVPGDTLWSIARDITPSDRSTAETVRMLRVLNELDTSSLLAGSSILVPGQETTLLVVQR